VVKNSARSERFLKIGHDLHEISAYFSRQYWPRSNVSRSNVEYRDSVSESLREKNQGAANGRQPFVE